MGKPSVRALASLPPGLVLVAALLVATTGGVAVASRHDPLVEVRVGASDRLADAPPSSAAARAEGGAPTTTDTVIPPTSTSTAAARPTPPAPPQTTPRPTARPAPATTPTTVDWRAEGLPGPVGSTIEPWHETPYVRAAEAHTTSLRTEAPADGGYPGTSLALTVTATFDPWSAGGSITLIGPIDNDRPWEQQLTRVLDSWTGGCALPYDRSVTRTATTNLAMERMVRPEYVVQDLHFHVVTTRVACDGSTVPGATLQLTFFVDDPYVVQPPSPPLGSTG